MYLKISIFFIIIGTLILVKNGSSKLVKRHALMTPFKSNFTSVQEEQDYLLKFQPYDKHSECSALKRLSSEYEAHIKLKYDFNIENDDLVQCKIKNPDFMGPSVSKFVIYTSGSATDLPSITKFHKTTGENCFSFRLKAKGVAKIFLYPKLYHHFKAVNLGSKDQPQTFVFDSEHSCDDCKIKKQPDLLSTDEFRGFWISWDNEKIKAGREHESSPFVTGTFSSIDEIEVIGIGTTGENYEGTWTIEDNFCPDLKKNRKERVLLADCHHIFDRKAVMETKTLSDEEKLWKIIKAFNSEFSIELEEKTITPQKLEKYYYENLNELYMKDYINLFKKCKTHNCDDSKLDSIGEEIDELRKKLEEEIKNAEIVMSNEECSSNGFFDDKSKKCKCGLGFAGNGIYCSKDTDFDGYPDYDIIECIEDKHCQKDNCPDEYNLRNDCESTTNIYTDSTIEGNFSKVDKTKRCLSVPLPTPGKSCELESKFSIKSPIDDESLEFYFSQSTSSKIFKFTWSKNTFPTFKINELNTDDDIPDSHYSTYFKSSNLLYKFHDDDNIFKFGGTYKMIINYENGKFGLRINYQGEDILSTGYMISNHVTSLPFTILCSPNTSMDWNLVAHKCY